MQNAFPGCLRNAKYILLMQNLLFKCKIFTWNLLSNWNISLLTKNLFSKHKISSVNAKSFPSSLLKIQNKNLFSKHISKHKTQPAHDYSKDDGGYRNTGTLTQRSITCPSLRLPKVVYSPSLPDTRPLYHTDKHSFFINVLPKAFSRQPTQEEINSLDWLSVTHPHKQTSSGQPISSQQH